MTKQALFWILVIGIYLKFGAWDLVLPYALPFAYNFKASFSASAH